MEGVLSSVWVVNILTDAVILLINYKIDGRNNSGELDKEKK
jgi:hypothetical protein